jgi:hypothetical protein
MNASKEYTELISDLGTLYGVLRLSHDMFGSNLEKVDSQTRETLEDIIKGIYRVLGELKKVQEKMYPSGRTKGLETLWKGLAWAVEKPKLVELRTKVNEKITLLDYCRTGLEL